MYHLNHHKDHRPVKKGKVSQYQINEYWADIGNLEDLKLADQLYSSLTES